MRVAGRSLRQLVRRTKGLQVPLANNAICFREEACAPRPGRDGARPNAPVPNFRLIRSNLPGADGAGGVYTSTTW